jgi:hypothetical protein
MARPGHTYSAPALLREVLYSRGAVEGDCLVYTGARQVRGYGKINVQRRTELAHRAAWILENGPIEKGLVVMHTCDNPPCFRLAHLRLGTQADNNADKMRKGREFRGPARVKMSLLQQQRIREAAAVEAGVPVDWRRCPQCDTWKPQTDYGPNAQRRDGRSLYCKPCAAAYRRAHR